MNPTDLPLRDIHLPDAVSWWPPAPGWWVVAVVVVLLLWWAARRWQRQQKWRRSPAYLAAMEFDRLRSSWRGHHNAQQLAQDLSTWLRRVGMSLQSRRAAASLTGDQWLQYLDQLGGDTILGSEVGRVLSEAPYREAVEVDGDQLLTVCERWLQAVTQRQRALQ